jgi:hypothetical protein
MSFVVCIDNTGYPASLERSKIYKTVPDALATQHGKVRVFDESGESYLYPAELFEKIPVPESVAKALASDLPTEVQLSRNWFTKRPRITRKLRKWRSTRKAVA